jgi:hypothetical protein
MNPSTTCASAFSWPRTLSIALTLVVMPSLARAQTMSIYQEKSLPRENAEGKDVTKRPQQLNPEGINLQDCRDDLRIRIPMLIAGFAVNDTIEIWASDQGTKCSDPVQRTSSTALCYKLDGLAQLSTNPTFRIPVKSIIRGRAAEDQLDADGCRRLNSGTVTLQFLYFKGAPTGTPAQEHELPLKVDTQGPNALTGLRVLPGNTRLTVSWNAVGEGGVADMTGVRAFCVPNPSASGGGATQTVCDPVDEAGDEGGALDASCREVVVGGEGGTIPDQTGIASTGTACSAAEFLGEDGKPRVPDKDFASKYQCGSINTLTGSSLGAESVGGQPLANGTTYAVTAAAVDSFDNIGELSTVVCQWPEPTSDFWREYRGAGGNAGGCSETGVGAPIGSFAAIGIAGALALSALRRRRPPR